MTERRVEPIVQSPSRRKHSRTGRGFSVKEVQDAGLTVAKAKKLGITVDKRRRTFHPENTRMLKIEYVITFPLIEIKGVGKSAEKELVRAGVFDARDLAEMDIDELSTRVKYSKAKLKGWQAEAKRTTSTKLPQ
jgi:predicted flap endonuclease-1-like 5' DNA nuclease